METKIIDKKEIMQAVDCIKKGGVITFPTDTVFGIGVVYDNLDALKRLKESKGRPESKPIPMMIGSFRQLESVAIVNEKVKNLVHQFMPGGFTVILNKNDQVDDEITNGFKTIALRMPDDAFILELIQQVGKPLLVTSANLSGQPTGICFEDVKRDFEGRVDMMVEGNCGGSVSSTIVDATGDELKIVRLGAIREEEILKAWDS